MLTEKLQEMYRKTRTGYYRKFRTGGTLDTLPLREKYGKLDPYQAMKEMYHDLLCAEKCVIIPGENFYFTRTFAYHYFRPHPCRVVENLAADYAQLLREGLDGRIAAAERKLQSGPLEPESREFLETALAMLRETKAFALRYADAAEKAGDAVGAAMLRKVPAQGAETLREALQSVFFMFSMFHHTAVSLQGFGRIDQYLYPYYEHDRKNGMTREQAKELISEFFLMLNRENDLYGMVQPGDDGESLMLGGCDRQGNPADNELTRIILESSYDVSMINPKINLRVDSRTPQDLLELGVKLTGRGLGFPQYENDEVVIPALVNFGYELEDARDYTVAACWEFVIPGARDIPNWNWMNLPLAADRAIRSALRDGRSFETLLGRVKDEIRNLASAMAPVPREQLTPNPLFSAFSGSCIERGMDLHRGGAKYYNYGCLSGGSSTAADSLAAVKKFVYDEKKVSPERLLHALETDYADDEELRLLMKQGPKTGDNDEESNAMLRVVFDAFADVLEACPENPMGGRIRPGTGSAQSYVYFTQYDNPLHLYATADGRKNMEYISSSLAPAPGVRSPGLLSVLQTYGKLDYKRLCNGGPITVEFAPEFFRDPEAVKKTSGFVRAFVKTGCQQIQMNVLDREVLLDAQKHPENHRDLIVRVWGWSGYFVELAKEYQDQIINRQTYNS